jgi:hypothetical protein
MYSRDLRLQVGDSMGKLLTTVDASIIPLERIEGRIYL